MKYVIVSDIHGNLEALEAARGAIERISPDRVLCLGDVVGYGASPNECVEITRELASVTVAGNHDHGVAGLTDIRYFNSYARQAVLWTARMIGPEGADFLGGLPFEHVEDGRLRIVHATPSDPARWNYIFTHQQALHEFASFPEPVCFVGHSHQAGIFELADEDTVIVRRDRAEINSGSKYIINAGSVGQPRDGDPRAAICVYDDAREEVLIERVAYDVEGAKTKILLAGLPPILAYRLSHGE